MPRVFINLTDEQKRDVERRAFDKRTTLSNYVRALLGFPAVDQGKKPKEKKK